MSLTILFQSEELEALRQKMQRDKTHTLDILKDRLIKVSLQDKYKYQLLVIKWWSCYKTFIIVFLEDRKVFRYNVMYICLWFYNALIVRFGYLCPFLSHIKHIVCNYTCYRRWWIGVWQYLILICILKHHWQARMPEIQSLLNTVPYTRKVTEVVVSYLIVHFRNI